MSAINVSKISRLII